MSLNPSSLTVYVIVLPKAEIPFILLLKLHCASCFHDVIQFIECLLSNYKCCYSLLKYFFKYVYIILVDLRPGYNNIRKAYPKLLTHFCSNLIIYNILRGKYILEKEINQFFYLIFSLMFAWMLTYSLNTILLFPKILQVYQELLVY